MRKVKKANELLWLFGILFVAFGVSICNKADLGVSMIAAPAFVLSQALSELWAGLSVGVTEYIIQGVMLVGLCVIVKGFNWRYLLAFAVAVVYGYTLDFFLWLMKDVSFNTIAMRWVMLIVGDVVVGFGVACFFRTYMPLQVYELFVAEIARCFNITIGKVKFGFDMALLAISLVLAFTLFGDVKIFDWTKIGYTSFHSIGLGTLVTAAINSPIINAMGKLVDRFFEPEPRFKKMEQILKR